MPIKKVQGGYRWGSSGKVYPTRQGAEKQAQAAYANGYKEDPKRKAYSNAVQSKIRGG